MITGINKERKKKLSYRKQRFFNFLKENPVGVLCTVTPDKEPHGSVIYIDVDQDCVVYFLTKSETKKRDNIKHNNHVMLTVFEPKQQAVVQIEGEAFELKDDFRVNVLANAILGASLRTGTGGLPPVTKLDSGTYVGYKILPKQARMAIYSSTDPDNGAGIFDSIESFDFEDVC